MKNLLIALLLSSLALSANATMVTFDELSDEGTPFSSGGLTFTGINTFAWNTDSGSSDNGTQALIVGWESSVVITREGGGLFSLDSFDAGLSWYTSLNSLVINVGGESITIGTGYSNFSFTSLGSVSSVTIGNAPVDGYFAIDNITWSEVPEPTSLALLGLGIAGIGFARKKKIK